MPQMFTPRLSHDPKTRITLSILERLQIDKDKPALFEVTDAETSKAYLVRTVECGEHGPNCFCDGLIYGYARYPECAINS